MKGQLTCWHDVVSTEADCFQRMRASTVFRCFQELAMEQGERDGYGREMNERTGLYWVVSRLYAEYYQVPMYGQRVQIRTWPGKKTRAMFPRYCDILDESGNVMIRSCGAWMLLDGIKRTMVLPGKADLQMDGIETGQECPSPGPLREREYDSSILRRVGYSELDTNRHMNNTRYFDWIDDILPLEFHRDYRLQRLQLNYLHELCYDQEAQLQWKLDGTHLVAKASAEGQDKFRFEADYVKV